MKILIECAVAVLSRQMSVSRGWQQETCRTSLPVKQQIVYSRGEALTPSVSAEGTGGGNSGSSDCDDSLFLPSNPLPSLKAYRSPLNNPLWPRSQSGILISERVISCCLERHLINET